MTWDGQRWVHAPGLCADKGHETANLSPDLDAIQARVDAATEGPWMCRSDHAVVQVADSKGEQLAGVVYGPAYRPDAEFIAHARTDVPALLALVREQQAQIGRVRELHTPFTHHFLSPPAGSLEVCHSCHESYPCPTVAALTATEGAQ